MNSMTIGARVRDVRDAQGIRATTLSLYREPNPGAGRVGTITEIRDGLVAVAMPDPWPVPGHEDGMSHYWTTPDILILVK